MRLARMGLLLALAVVAGGGYGLRAQAPRGGTRAGWAGPTGRFFGWRVARREGRAAVASFRREADRVARPRRFGLVGTTPSASTSGAGLALPGLAARPAFPAGALTSAVATGDFNRDGKADFIAADAAQNRLWLYLGNGNGTFQAPSLVALSGQTPICMAAGDLQEMGYDEDLVVGEADSDSVEVLLANGDGTFAPGTLYTMPGPVIALQLADVNGDGHLDIVALVAGVGVEVLLGKGNGTFATTPLLSAAQPGVGPAAVGMVVAKFNSSGPPGIALVIPELQYGGFPVDVLAGNGDGTFSNAVIVSRTLATPRAITAGDLGGGCQDLIYSDASGELHVLPGNCDGTFGAETDYMIGDNEVTLAVADVNGDGHMDVVGTGAYENAPDDAGFAIPGSPPFGNVGGDSLAVMLGNGQGGLARARLYRGEPFLYGLAAADFRGDGRTDFVAVSQSAGQAVLFFNDGSGGFGTPEGESLGFTPGPTNDLDSLPMAADLNGDGQPDLGFIQFGMDGDRNAASVLSQGGWVYGPPVVSALMNPAPPGSGEIADCLIGQFHDGQTPDLVCGGVGTSNEAEIAFGNGDGTFAPPVTLGGPEPQPAMLVAGDFNGDGHLDFAAVTALPNSTDPAALGIAVFLGHGDGTFTEVDSTAPMPVPAAWDGSVVWSTYTGLTALYAGDFNHDGKLDLLAATPREVVTLAGNGDGTFGPPQPVPVSAWDDVKVFQAQAGGPWVLAAVPGQAAFAAQPATPPTVEIYLGQPDGSFALSQSFTLQQWNALPDPGDMIVGTIALPIVGDFNGDGIPDMAIGETDNFREPQPGIYGDSQIQFLVGRGDGTFVLDNDVFPMYKPELPQEAVPGGSGAEGLVEFDDVVSGMTVIPPAAGPPFQLALMGTPIAGTTGQGEVTLALPSATDTTITLASSEAGVTVPASVVVPAGSSSATFSVQVQGVSRALPFNITASNGTYATSATGTLAWSTPGFALASFSNPAMAVVAGSTASYGAEVQSVAGYQTNVSFSCAGLPQGLSCAWTPSSIALPAGGAVEAGYQIAVPTSFAAGSYGFAIEASDGVVSQSAAETLVVAAAPAPQLAIMPVFSDSFPAQFLMPNGNAAAPFFVSANQSFAGGTVQLQCAGPQGATCNVQPSSVTLAAGGQQSAVADIVTSGATPGGSGSVSVTATSGTLTSAPMPMPLFIYGVVLGAVASPSGTKLAAGASLPFQLSLQGQNDFSGTVTLGCSGVPNNLSCSFAPAVVTLDGTAPIADTLTLARAATAAAATRRGPLSPPSPGLAAAAACLLGLLGLGWAAEKRRRALAAAVLAMTLALMCACGGGSPPATPPASGGGGSTPQPVTAAVTIVATSPGLGTETLGQVQVTEPQ